MCPELSHYIKIPKISYSQLYICSAESINLEMPRDELWHWQLHPYCSVYHHVTYILCHRLDHYHIDGFWLLTLICPRCPWIATTCSSMGRRRGAPWMPGLSSATSTWAHPWSWRSGCLNFPCRWNFLITISASSKAGGFPFCPTEGEASVNFDTVTTGLVLEWNYSFMQPGSYFHGFGHHSHLE